MKTKDIKPGTVYAYRAGSKYGVIRPVVFLAPADSDNLYRDANHRSWSRSGVNYQRHEQATKPAANSSHYGPIGWPAATVERNADMPALAGVALAGFEAATEHTERTEAGSVTYMLVTSAAHILGEYDEVVAAQQVERDEYEAARRRAEAADEARRDRAEAQIEALADFGIEAFRDTEIRSRLTLHAADVDKLLRLLADRS